MEATVLVNGILTAALLHTNAVDALVITGLGLTVTVTVVVEVQPAGDVAVTVNTVTCCTLVIFVNVPLMVVPVPLLAIPVRLVVLLLVQLNVVLATAFGLLMVEAVMAMPEQTVWLLLVAATVGTGLTKTCTVVLVDTHEPAVAVMVNRVVCCTLVPFTNAPAMLAPPPLLPMPVRFIVLSLVQPKVVPATAFGLVIFIVLMATPPQSV